MSELSNLYVFWLYDYSLPFYRLILKMFPHSTICEIGDETLIASKYKPSLVRIYDISSVRHTYSISAKDWESTVEIDFNSGKGLALDPMNPLDPRQSYEARHEAEAMVAVIEAFRQGRTPDLDPNPYHRELKRQGREDEISRRVWDPYVSPWVYYRQDHPRPSLSKILLLTVATILAIGIGVALLVFLLETLSGGSL